jgi:hypothetical protein
MILARLNLGIARMRAQLFSRLAGVCLALALVGGAALALPASGALAAGQCKANPSTGTCDFKDPAAEGCKTDKQLKFRLKFFGPSGVMYVYKVFYSPACQSAWASVTKKTVNTQLMVGLLRNATFPLDSPNEVVCTGPAPMTCDTKLFFAQGNLFSIYGNVTGLTFPGQTVNIFGATIPPEPGD